MWKVIKRWLNKHLQIISPSEYILTGESNGWVACGRCKRPVRENKAEVCWYCNRAMCYHCWDKYGHCGHKEADEANHNA